MVSKFEQEFGKIAIQKSFATVEQIKSIILLLEDPTCQYSIDELLVAKGIMTLKQVNEIRELLEQENIVEKRIIPVKSRVSKIYRNSIQESKRRTKKVFTFVFTGLFFFFLSFLSYKLILDFIKNKKTEDMKFFLEIKKKASNIESHDERIELYKKVKEKYPKSKAEKLAEKEIIQIHEEKKIIQDEILEDIKFSIREYNYSRFFDITKYSNLISKREYNKILKEINSIEINNLIFYNRLNEENRKSIIKYRISLLKSFK